MRTLSSPWLGDLTRIALHGAQAPRYEFVSGYEDTGRPASAAVQQGTFTTFDVPGPLTLGQLNILQALSVVPDHFFFATLCAERDVPGGMSVERRCSTSARSATAMGTGPPWPSRSSGGCAPRDRLT
jgi:hypothetical protein